jgi:hypothetical protein
MVPPGCSFRWVIASARSPSTSVAFPWSPHGTASNERETTNLGTPLMWLANGSLVDVGQ